VEQEKVSHIIGKGGSVIKGIIKQSGTYVKFAPPKEGTNKQVGSITGPVECIGIALELITYQLAKYQSHDGKTQGGALALLIPSAQIGLIIGKQGAIVRSVQSQAGSRIQIASRPESSGDAPSDQEVTIFGSPAAITAAARVLLGHLFRQAMPPPAAYAVAQAYPIAPPTYWAPPPVPAPIALAQDSAELEVRFALRPNEVSRIIGKGGSGIQSLCKQARVKLVFDKQIQTSIGGPTIGPAQIGTVRGDAANISKALEIAVTTLATPLDDSESDKKEQKSVRFILMVPSPVIGFLLGTKGARIKETKEKSGAQINITGRADAIWDHVTGVALQAVILEGDSEQVVSAVQALVQQLEDARQHRGGRGARSGSSEAAEI